MAMDSMIEPAEHAAAGPRPTDGASADLAAVLMGAVDLPAPAIMEFSGPDVVGEYLGAGFEDPTSATHRFLATMPGYQGWQWAVVVAAHPGADHATISEVVLVPGPTALLAPQWVPWQERVQPGDLSPGDLLATPTDDPRLVPGYVSSGDPGTRRARGRDRPRPAPGAQPVGPHRGRRALAGRRVRTGLGDGPRRHARVCRDCGYYLPLTGSLGTVFGVCANEMSADGHVVADEYGCGAHSDTPRARRHRLADVRSVRRRRPRPDPALTGGQLRRPVAWIAPDQSDEVRSTLRAELAPRSSARTPNRC